MRTKRPRGQAGGLAIVKQRGPEYMSQISRNRKNFRGGRPRFDAEYLLRSQEPVEALDNQQKNKKGVMPDTAISSLLAQWRERRALMLGENLI